MPKMLIIDDIERILGDAEEHNHFKLHMGANISNLRELVEALDIMSDKTFGHHVTKKKNDFSSWIEDVFADDELAKSIKKTINRKKMKAKIEKRIGFLESNVTGNKICPHHFAKCGAGEFALGTVVGFLIGLVVAVFI